MDWRKYSSNSYLLLAVEVGAPRKEQLDHRHIGVVRSPVEGGVLVLHSLNR